MEFRPPRTGPRGPARSGALELCISEDELNALSRSLRYPWHMQATRATRRLVLAALALVAASAALAAQSSAPAAFEVASVKLDPKQDRGGPQSIDEISLPYVRVLPGGRVESHGHTLRVLIAWAWDINTLYRRIEGPQEFLETELVISARAATPTLTTAEARAMVGALLEERFRLRWRWQPREVDGYLLMPAREDGQPGPGLRTFTGDCEARADNPRLSVDSPDYEQHTPCNWNTRLERHRAVGVSMTAVAEQLSLLMAAPVADRTEWQGLFSFDVTASTRDMPYMDILRPALGGRAPPPADSPRLLDALHRELGLKLVGDRAATNDFIVDQVEPLIEN